MPARSPSARQMAGLGVTLATVALFCGFSLWQVQGLRKLREGPLDRNRRNTLQLVRIQNDLTHIGLTLIDLRGQAGRSGIAVYRGQLQRLHADLSDAIAQEALLAPASRTREQSVALANGAARFWEGVERMLREDGSQKKDEDWEANAARLDGVLAELDGIVARLLQENRAAEASVEQETAAFYARGERNIYVFLGAMLAAVAITGVLTLRWNRRLFQEMETLSERRRELAAKVMTVQEETFRQLAREIHDEFGQVLTAMGMMLARVEKRLPAEEERLRTDLREVREVAQQTLERARSLSRMLHPPVLDDYGLEKSVEWYLGQFRHQSGIAVHYEKTGAGPVVRAGDAIHIYRILQEALSNIARHAGVREAWVRAHFAADRIHLEVEDHGKGMPAQIPPGSIGLVAMRERAALLHGSIEFSRPSSGGTRLELRVPLRVKGEDQ